MNDVIAKAINRVIHADCLNVLRYLPDKSVDLCLTDFPYGVNIDYDGYHDSQANLISLINAVMPEILRVSKRALITTGQTNLWHYPVPEWLLGWIVPAGTGRNPWGFTTWHPILAYGKDPYLANGLGSRHDTIKKIETSADVDHPCPKPTQFWTSLLLRGSINEDDIILDPFAGSGTTGVACIRTKRRYILIEQSDKYCSIA